MTQLAQLDLNRVGIDAESFLGRAVALGRKFEQLPDGFEAGLGAFLRVQGMRHAQRYRRGIALGREGLEGGVRRAFICIELAVEQEAKGDVNAAVEILAQSSFEAWRKLGWETALLRLERMRAAAAAWQRGPWVRLLYDHRVDIDIWRQVAPEAWQGRDDEGEAVDMDPRGDYRRFEEVEARALFLQALPYAAVEELVESLKEDLPFGAVLRQIVASLALGLERLVLKRGEAAGLALVEADVLEALQGPLEKAVEEARCRALIAEEMRQQVDLLAASADRESLLVTGSG